jgi:hypothetical protein
MKTVKSEELAEFRGEVPHLLFPHLRPGTSGTRDPPLAVDGPAPCLHAEADVGGHGGGHDENVALGDPATDSPRGLQENYQRMHTMVLAMPTTVFVLASEGLDFGDV